MKKSVFRAFLFAVILLPSCKKEKLPELFPSIPYSLDIEADSIGFAVIGDYGKDGDNAFEVSTLVKSWTPDFIITLGDNNYQDGEFSTINENVGQYYCDYIYNPDAPVDFRCSGVATDEQQNRFFPTLGNHDNRGGWGNLPYRNYFSLPGNEIYYDFQWGPVHFFTVDSDVENGCCNSEQAQWLKEQLEQSDRLFKIVYFHHSPYSASKHGNHSEMQWPFKEWGADAVLAGHDHVYEKILRTDQSTFPYFVNGLGGNSLYGCYDNLLDPNDFDVFCYNQDYGAMLCKATREQLTFQFFAINDPSTPIDEYVINK